MIIIDEQLNEEFLIEDIASWYSGPVQVINDLRPSTNIKDDNIPSILHRNPHSTFVTINVNDFWKKVECHQRYSVVCFPLSTERRAEIPGLLRRLFRLPLFSTKASRVGKILLVTGNKVEYYTKLGQEIVEVTWPK